MKKVISLLICVMMIISSSLALNVFANDDIKIIIDGANQAYDQMPVIQNDRTLVPLRGIFEALGANVDWIGDTRTVVIKSPEFAKNEYEQQRFENGVVVLDSKDLINMTRKTITQSEGSILDYVDDKLYVNVKTLPQNDLGVTVTFKSPIGGTIKQSDVCLMTFKARLISGGENGVGYIKAWAQNDKTTKALFARTDVGTEWTDCYLPFVGIADMRDIGFRFGGMVQELEIKDFNLINYGPKKNIKTLKSTALRGDNTVAQVYIDDVPVAP